MPKKIRWGVLSTANIGLKKVLPAMQKGQFTIVSAIARYLGKSWPDAMDRVMRAIPIEQHGNVVRAVVLLRLALALNQDRASAVVRMRTHVYPKRVVIELVPGRGGAELEAWSLKKEAAYFREVFRRDLVVEVA